MRLAVFLWLGILLKATVATATEGLDASVCNKAEDDYIKSLVDIDEKFQKAAEAIELRKLFFDPEKALIDGVPFGCNFEKPIYAERHSSLRPRLRPSNLIVEHEAETSEPELSLSDILREVTENKNREADNPAKSYHVPLTSGEVDKFRHQVGNCWKVDSKSRAANVTVTIAMEMQPDGKVVASSLEMIG